MTFYFAGTEFYFTKIEIYIAGCLLAFLISLYVLVMDILNDDNNLYKIDIPASIIIIVLGSLFSWLAVYVITLIAIFVDGPNDKK